MRRIFYGDIDFKRCSVYVIFFFQAEDGIRDLTVTGVQTCALPIIVLALLGCGAEPGAQSSSPPAGQDTVLIAGRALYVQSGFNVNLFAEGLGGVRSLALGPGGARFPALTGARPLVPLADADRDRPPHAPAQPALGGLH